MKDEILIKELIMDILKEKVKKGNAGFGLGKVAEEIFSIFVFELEKAEKWDKLKKIAEISIQDSCTRCKIKELCAETHISPCYYAKIFVDAFEKR